MGIITKLSHKQIMELYHFQTSREDQYWITDNFWLIVGLESNEFYENKKPE
jgi:outer membrane translocation and assembly module TamA